MSVIKLERCSTPEYLSESSEPKSDIELVELIAEDTYYDPMYDCFQSWLEGLENGVPYYVDETDPEELVPTFGIHLSVASSTCTSLSTEESSLDNTSHPPYEDESFADDEADSESIIDTDIEDSSSYEWGVTISASE